jgi:Na+/H+-translocating membrane pyrophosphatase
MNKKENFINFVFIPTVFVLGFIFSLINTYSISKIKVNPLSNNNKDKNINIDVKEVETQKNMFHIYNLIKNGAMQFLLAEYKYLVVFLILFGSIIISVIGMSTKEWDLAVFSLICFFLEQLDLLSVGS